VESTPKGLVLLPISLMLDGRFYDATLYHANPVPMALDPGNVYEVQRSGEAEGDFTITETEQWPNGAWLGRGTWLSNEEKTRRAEAREKAGAKPAKPAEDEDEGPPKLTRGGQKKPESPSPEPTSKDQKPAAAPTASEARDTSEDSDHPVLRRGKPLEEQAAKLGANADITKPQEAAKPTPGFEQLKVAVSDATNTESRPYVWKWANSEEEQKIRSSIQKLALEAVRAYATRNGGPPPGNLENLDIRAFDLEYSNSADVILSARVRPAEAPGKKLGSKSASLGATPSDFQYYVTIVAREDIYAQLQKSLTVVTDSRHLDAFPRMQLIDAVDADGNGGGDLLFRRISDLGSSLVLYRVNSSRLDEILRVPEPKLN
jgi:hypothetical protein